MTPSQRAAAERLAAYHAEQADHFSPFGSGNALTIFHGEAAALLRELLAEPQGEPVAWLKTMYSGTRPMLEVDHLSPPATTSIPVYAHPPQQRKPLKTAMEAEIECDCLVAWNASTYGHSAQDTVHPMFLSAFLRGYRAAERAHGIGETP